MKTAVTIPNEVFKDAERLARRLRTTRSRLYSMALSEFVGRHSPERMTESLNRVVQQVGPEIDPFVLEASRQRLKNIE